MKIMMSLVKQDMRLSSFTRFVKVYGKTRFNMPGRLKNQTDSESELLFIVRYTRIVIH